MTESSAAAWGTHHPHGLTKACLVVYGADVGQRAKRRLRRFLEQAADVYDVTRRGLKMRCHIRDNITEHDIVFGGRYDNSRELAFIEARLPRGGIFVDIGANCGLFSLAAARKVGQHGRVLAIEPNPTMVERIRFNVAANGFGNVDVVECAIGDSTGTAELKICARELGQSSFAIEVEGPRMSVPVRTLPNVIEELGIERVDVLKVDVEGFEDRVVMPLLRADAPSLWPRSILIEIRHAHLWREGCVIALKDAGYSIEWEDRSDMLLSLAG